MILWWQVHALRHSSGPEPAPSVPRCDRPFHLDDMHQGQWRVDPLAPPEAFWTSFNTSSDRMLYKWAVPRERPAPLEQEQTRACRALFRLQTFESDNSRAHMP